MQSQTHVSFAGVGGADVSADVEVSDEAVALRRVNSGSKRQRGTILRGGELHLSQIVDEEVEFGGDAAQTGLDQPAQVTQRQLERGGLKDQSDHFTVCLLILVE